MLFASKMDTGEDIAMQLEGELDLDKMAQRVKCLFNFDTIWSE